MSGRKAVLDASAILAWLFDEPGADSVALVLARGVLATANLAEVLRVVARRGYTEPLDDVPHHLEQSGLRLVDNLPADAVVAARLMQATHGSAGALSLGDGLCIATAARLGLPVVGADRHWESFDLPVTVHLIR